MLFRSLLVTIGGLYLLHLDVLSSVLILTCAVLLARLDLARIRVVPPPFVLALSLALVVLVGSGIGHRLSTTHLNHPEALFRRTTPSPLERHRLSPGLKRLPLYGRISSRQEAQGHPHQHEGGPGLR